MNQLGWGIIMEVSFQKEMLIFPLCTLEVDLSTIYLACVASVSVQPFGSKELLRVKEGQWRGRKNTFPF